jgi:hypothetical protein
MGEDRGGCEVTDMTSEAIDRAMRTVAARFAAEAEVSSSKQRPETELAEDPAPYITRRD